MFLGGLEGSYVQAEGWGRIMQGGSGRRVSKGVFLAGELYGGQELKYVSSGWIMEYKVGRGKRQGPVQLGMCPTPLERQ